LNLAAEGGEEGEQVIARHEHRDERESFHSPSKVISLNVAIVICRCRRVSRSRRI
jgi:hypothetical protein